MKQRLRKNGVVPVVKINDAGKAVPLARALLEGGLDVIEITFRTAAAVEAIALIKKEVPEMLLGAGTVLSLENLEKAAAAGVDFVVSPGYNPKIVDRCIEMKLPVFPGVCTPTEIEAAMDRGLTSLKFFPAEASGGTEMLKALSAVYEVDFMPTGGIGPKNLRDYLALPKVACVGGSWLVKSDLIDGGRFDEITRLAREAVEVVKDMRGAKNV
jgi:2-dehydro-3-deoxyphosphogluconate aldolase/(4S)-4-hydroxy-2-oxoglutarate aldolase